MTHDLTSSVRLSITDDKSLMSSETEKLAKMTRLSANSWAESLPSLRCTIQTCETPEGLRSTLIQSHQSPLCKHLLWFSRAVETCWLPRLKLKIGVNMGLAMSFVKNCPRYFMHSSAFTTSSESRTPQFVCVVPYLQPNQCFLVLPRDVDMVISVPGWTDDIAPLSRLGTGQELS